jgi:hypothetical protein
MVFLVIALPQERSAPGLLEIGSYPVPLVVELSAQPLLNFVFVLRKAVPWFLAQRKMGGDDLLQGPGPAVLTVLLARHALSVDNVVDRPLVSGIVRHLVEDAMVELDGLALVENVVKIGDDSLEGHGPVKDATDATPSAAFRKVSFANDFDKFVVDLHVGSQDQESTLDGLGSFLFGSAHIIWMLFSSITSK